MEIYTQMIKYNHCFKIFILILIYKDAVNIALYFIFLNLFEFFIIL